MKKCLIIINSAAGKSRKISFDKVESRLGDGYCYSRFSLPEDGEYALDGYDAVAVCGGDGTLGALLSKAADMPIDVYYFPSGTLNDRAKSKRYEHVKSNADAARGRQIVVGKYERLSDIPKNDEDDKNDPPIESAPTRGSSPLEIAGGQSAFSYVLAAGSFTPIGYMADAGLKRRLGALAYVFQIIKQYRIYRIPAEIDVGEKKFDGEFSLIMALKSPRCFGFRFNRAFDPESVSGHLVAIRSPKHGGIVGLAEMFFPFFRVFFMGLKREREGKILFKKIYSCNVVQKRDETYCRDGEKYVCPKGTLKISFKKTLCNFCVIDKFKQKNRAAFIP